MAIQIVTPGGAGLPINAPLGQGNESGVNAYGGVAIVKATGLSSDLVLAATSLWTAYNGDVYIDNLIFKTDATGLAGMTNVVIGQDGVLGNPTLVTFAQSSFNTTYTGDLYFRSATGVSAPQRTVIAQGKHLTIAATIAPGTGAGNWSLYVIYRPLVANATLA